MHGSGLISAAAISLASIPDRYRVILCDVWGCVHDGVHVYPEAEALLIRWRREGRTVILITNAPRTAVEVGRQLDRLSFSRDAYDAIVTSGETGLAALREAGRDTVGFIGTGSDRAVLAEAGLHLLDGADGDTVVCTGLGEGISDASHYDPLLAILRSRGAWLLCFNPDRAVMRGDIAEPCAGAIAERYEARGGKVGWYGKPYAAVYERALAIASRLAGKQISWSEVLAIGDGLATDAAGAATMGMDFVFVTHGIHAQAIAAEGVDALIARFGAEHGIDLPPPLAIVPRLA